MIVSSNGLNLYCEVEGDVSGDAVLLIGGLGSHATDWDRGLVDALLGAGLRVIRFDNRDSGESAFIDSPVDLMSVAIGDFSSVPYGLSDMASDVIGLLDALNIDKAHLIGHSLGAMIAQVVTIEYPERVASLVSASATTGSRMVGQPHPGIGELLLQRSDVSATPEERLAASVKASMTWSSMDFGVTVDDLRQRALRRAARTSGIGGSDRQLAAVLSASDRTEPLAEITVPALIIHGADDPLIDVSGGRASADAISGSTLMILDGVRHDIPPSVLPEVSAAMIDHIKRAS